MEEQRIESSPKERSRKHETSDPWVWWFDSKNSTPLKYANRALRSPTHADCINKFVNFAVGENLETEDEAFIELMDKVNAYGESWQDVNVKTTTDYKTNGNIIIEIVNIGGSFQFYHRYSGDFLPSKSLNDKTKKPEHYYYSRDWRNKNLQENKPIKYTSFPNFSKVEGQKGLRSIYHIKRYTPSKFYIGIPDWIQAKEAVDIEYLIDKYNRDQFENDFLANYLVTLRADLESNEEKEVVKTKFQDDFTDVEGDKAGKPLVEVLPSHAENGTVITKIERDTDGKFTELREYAAKTIIKSHGFTPRLMGIIESGKLGSATELMIEFEMAKNQTIQPYQTMLLNHWWKIWDFCKIQAPDDLRIPVKSPINLGALVDLEKIYTIDELRYMHSGAPELENGQGKRLINSNGTNNSGTGN